MNFLSLFVLVPVLMTCAMFLCRNMRQIRAAMMTGASALLALSVALTFMFLGERGAGNAAEMLFTADAVWYAPLNIHYSVGVDGIFAEIHPDPDHAVSDGPSQLCLKDVEQILTQAKKYDELTRSL